MFDIGYGEFEHRYCIRYQVFFRYEKRLLLRFIHHLKSDLIYNIDDMLISGTEHSSVILSQTKLFKKLKNYTQKVPVRLKSSQG